MQWAVECLVSVLHSFKVKYVLKGKDRSLEMGSSPHNTMFTMEVSLSVVGLSVQMGTCSVIRTGEPDLQGLCHPSSLMICLDQDTYPLQKPTFGQMAPVLPLLKEAEKIV